MNSDTEQNQPPVEQPDAAADSLDIPPTPERLMQAASARIAALEAELSEAKDRWMRSEAEMANVRARAKREVDETRQYAVQKFARDAAEAAENLRRGLDSLPPHAEGEPAIVGNLHQAMAEQETGDHPPGTVLQAWTPAWTLNGRLLRPAMVVVAKAPAPEAAAAAARFDQTA